MLNKVLGHVLADAGIGSWRRVSSFSCERYASSSAATILKLYGRAPRYDAEKIKNAFRERKMFVLRRRLQIAVPLTMFIGRVVVDVQLGREKEKRIQRATEFMKLIASLGPAFIKAGQALSTRPDLLPQEYLTELEKLQDRLPPFPTELALKQVEEALETNIEKVFSHFDAEPVAAASIGQVYKATLITGEQVAVKVQRPRCQSIVALDLHILRELSGFLNKLLAVLKRDVDLKAVIDEFGRLIYEEMDYVAEALNADKFQELYGDMEGIKVPKVHWKYTRRKVLALEWVNGVRLDSAPARKPELVKTLLNCSLKQMLGNGFFHADPHGGNLLATDDEKLCYLDFGMMSHVAPNQRYGIILAVVHLVNRDWEAMVNLYVRLGFIPLGTDTGVIVKALEDGLPDVLDSTVADFNFTSVIRELGSIIYTHPIQLPKYYTAILRCMAVLEGVALRVAPQVKIVNEAYPFIAATMLSEDSVELQDALMLLLFKDGHIRKNRLLNLLMSAASYREYDMSRFLNSFVHYLLESEDDRLRENLAEDMATELDEIGYDMAKYATSTLARSSFVSPLLREAFSVVPEPVVTERLRVFRYLIESFGQSDDFRVEKIMPLLQR
mmetsp:Transcript_39872/g.158630  ORF Transcript_39872/g.158630 Transcript_39872/m.158630 type:complete len:612 (-) Transcript_39872:2381-4216(-)